MRTLKSYSSTESIHSRLKWLTIITLLIAFSNCSKKEQLKTEDPIVTQETDIPLTEEQITLLDELDIDTSITLEDLKFDDGSSMVDFVKEKNPDFLTMYPSKRSSLSNLSVPEKRKLFIAQMEIRGKNLVDRSNYQKNGQNGLAYIFSGNKDYTKLRLPDEGYGCRDKKLYGLDCSGMAFHMLKSAGLDNLTASSTTTLGDLNIMNNTFKNSVDFKELIIKEVKPSPVLGSGFKCGDIIIWPGRHIGIVLFNSKNELVIFQSSGSANSPGCQMNTDINHGPTIKRLTTGFLTHKSFGGIYKVFRITAGTPCGTGNQAEVTYKQYGNDSLQFFISGGYAPYTVRFGEECCKSSPTCCVFYTQLGETIHTVDCNQSLPLHGWKSGSKLWFIITDANGTYTEYPVTAP